MFDTNMDFNICGWLVGWLCFNVPSKARLETAPPFTVPYEGREAR